MRRIEWSDQLSLGIVEIDDQHKKLVNIANLFIASVEKGKGRAVIEKTIRDLREYTVFHFHSEEKYMESIAYPRLLEHRNEHQKLVYRVKEYQRDLYLKKQVTPDGVLDFLKGWLIDHVIYADLEISKWLRQEDQDGNDSKPNEGIEDNDSPRSRQSVEKGA